MYKQLSSPTTHRPFPRLQINSIKPLLEHAAKLTQINVPMFCAEVLSGFVLDLRLDFPKSINTQIFGLQPPSNDTHKQYHPTGTLSTGREHLGFYIEDHVDLRTRPMLAGFNNLCNNLIFANELEMLTRWNNKSRAALPTLAAKFHENTMNHFMDKAFTHTHENGHVDPLSLCLLEAMDNSYMKTKFKTGSDIKDFLDEIDNPCVLLVVLNDSDRLCISGSFHFVALVYDYPNDSYVEYGFQDPVRY